MKAIPDAVFKYRSNLNAMSFLERHNRKHISTDGLSGSMKLDPHYDLGFFVGDLLYILCRTNLIDVRS